MFQILTMTEARLVTVTLRSEKHGDDEKPAVSMGIEIECPNTLLDAIDPTIRQTLYMAVPDQEQLPGVEPATPVLRSNSIENVQLIQKYEGWTLNIDDGIDDTKPMAFGGCKVDKFRVEPKQGGTCTVRTRVGTSDLDKERSGMLGMHVGQRIWITLTPPEKPAAPIDGSNEAFAKDHPEAGDLFAAAHGDADPTELATGSGEAAPAHTGNEAGDWPFPGKGAAADQAPPQSATTEKPGRTARGRAATKKALAEGAPQ